MILLGFLALLYLEYHLISPKKSRHPGVLHSSPLWVTPVLIRLTGSRRLPSLAVIETSQKCGQGCVLSFSLLSGSWGSVVGERTCLMSALTCVLPLRGAAVKGGAEAALRYIRRQIASYFRGLKRFKHNYGLIVVGLLTHNCFQSDLSFFSQALWLLWAKIQEKASVLQMQALKVTKDHSNLCCNESGQSNYVSAGLSTFLTT